MAETRKAARNVVAAIAPSTQGEKRRASSKKANSKPARGARQSSEARAPEKAEAPEKRLPHSKVDKTNKAHGFPMLALPVSSATPLFPSLVGGGQASGSWGIVQAAADGFGKLTGGSNEGMDNSRNAQEEPRAGEGAEVLRETWKRNLKSLSTLRKGMDDVSPEALGSSDKDAMLVDEFVKSTDSKELIALVDSRERARIPSSKMLQQYVLNRHVKEMFLKSVAAKVPFSEFDEYQKKLSELLPLQSQISPLAAKELSPALYNDKGPVDEEEIDAPSSHQVVPRFVEERVGGIVDGQVSLEFFHPWNRVEDSQRHPFVYVKGAEGKVGAIPYQNARLIGLALEQGVISEQEAERMVEQGIQQPTDSRIILRNDAKLQDIYQRLKTHPKKEHSPLLSGTYPKIPDGVFIYSAGDGEIHGPGSSMPLSESSWYAVHLGDGAPGSGKYIKRGGPQRLKQMIHDGKLALFIRSGVGVSKRKIHSIQELAIFERVPKLLQEMKSEDEVAYAEAKERWKESQNLFSSAADYDQRAALKYVGALADVLYPLVKSRRALLSAIESKVAGLPEDSQEMARLDEIHDRVLNELGDMLRRQRINPIAKDVQAALEGGVKE